MRQIPRTRHLYPMVAALAVLVLLSFGSCAGSGHERPPKAPDPARIEAHSAGLVSATSAIKVVFTRAMAAPGAEVPSGVFGFHPALSGKARWEDERTLSFSPDKSLSPGRNYRVEVDVGRVGGGSGGGGDYFSFDLRAQRQRVSVETLPPRVARDGGILVEGSLKLADGLSDKAVEAALSTSAGTLSWSHDNERTHHFTVSNIAAAGRPHSMTLRWNIVGSGDSGRGKAVVKLPSANTFELISARQLDKESGSRGVELAFSRSLDKGQDLRGLVSVEGVQDLRYTVVGSTVSLYSEAWPVLAKLRVEKGLKDSSGGLLAQTAAATVAFDWEKPQVRYLTKGNILPTSQGLILPIESMNLSGVIVEALRVHGDNMLQFLQVNDLESSNELRRVGEVVWHKDFELGWKDDWKNRWVRQGLDLGPLLPSRRKGWSRSA